MYKIVVPDKLKEIWETAENGFFPGDPMRVIAKKEFSSLKDVYKFLEKPDPLIKAIYGEPDEEGLYTFPFMEEPDPGVKPYKGKIGDQTSYWHNESIKEHSCYVAENLFEAGVRPSYAALIGVFHDCGKKYCAETNHAGEVWFNDHEYVSALLTACWTKNWHMGLNERQRKMLVAVVYGHMQCLLEWHKGTAASARTEKKFINEVTEFLGSEADALRAYGLVSLLGVCDEGARNGAAVDKKKVKRGKELIDQMA